MASSGHDYRYDEKRGSGMPPHMMDETPIARGVRTNSTNDDEETVRRGSRKHSVVASIKANYGLADPSYAESIKIGYDSTHRKLKPRHIQLIGIGGTIGTALYVQIGRGLLNGGPGSLFLAFTIW
jgi:amino acid permease